MSPPKRTTIHDVANRAGVSIATVSRVLGGSQKVNEEMSRRVLDAAAEVGYRPNAAARSLVSGRFRTIGLVMPDVGNAYFQDILKAVVTEAKKDGYRVVVIDSIGDADEEYEACLQQVPNVDGIILLSPRMSKAQLADVIAKAGAVSIVNRLEPGISAPMIVTDNAGACWEILEHLASLGHRRLVHVCGPTESWQARTRITALRRGAQRLGLELAVLEAEQGVEAGYAIADEALETGATAVIAFNDLHAFGVMTRLHDRGIRVPEDVSVTGFDDIELARFSRPAITTVGTPKLELGDGVPPSTPISTPLTVRGSTGPAAGA